MPLTDYGRFESQHETGTFDHNGCRLTYAWMGDGPPLVLVNGMGGDFKLFYRIFLDLSEDYRVIGYNHRGEVGDGTIPGGFSHDDLVDDFAALCDHLQLDSFHLLGFSFGGTVAQRYVIDHPGKASSLILSSAFARRPLLWYERWLTHLVWSTGLPVHRMPGRRLFSRFTHCRHLYRIDPERVCFLCDHSMETPSRTLVRRAMLIDQFDIRSRLNENDCPVLLLRGERDGIVPTKFSEELKQYLTGAMETSFPDVGHFLPLSVPDEFNSTLKTFLSEVNIPARVAR